MVELPHPCSPLSVARSNPALSQVKNVNPIEKLERSSLIVAETIQGVRAPALIKAEVYDAVAAYAALPLYSEV